MKLIIGLGNPGKDYEKTRHNIGFMVIDAIAREIGAELCNLSRWEAETAEAQVNGEKVIFMKPLTYMNNSGRAVGKFADYYKVDPKDIWVVSDDLDMPLGRIRIRHEGSSGGHNGLQSIIGVLGEGAFTRIRLGIEEFTGNLKATDEVRQQPDAAHFVLQPFSKREELLVESVVGEAARLILAGLKNGELVAHTHEVSRPTVV